MHHFLSIFLILFLLQACGEGEDSEIEDINVGDEVIFPIDLPSGNISSSRAPAFLVDTSSGEINIPPTIPSSAATMNTTIVPDGFSYNLSVNKQFTLDIRAYSISPAHVSIYGEFTENDDGSFKAHYNTRIISAPLENGQGILNYVSSEDQYYVLAEVWFYEETDPLQKRISSTETDWIW